MPSLLIYDDLWICVSSMRLHGSSGELCYTPRKNGTRLEHLLYLGSNSSFQGHRNLRIPFFGDYY
jgi:hypothetical protein